MRLVKRRFEGEKTAVWGARLEMERIGMQAGREIDSVTTVAIDERKGEGQADECLRRGQQNLGIDARS